MKLFLVDTWSEDGHVLSPEEQHYLIRVRRTKPGSRIRCSDSRGLTWDAELHEAGQKYILMPLEGSAQVARVQETRLHLVQAVPKGKKLDDILRHACELGVASLHLWAGDHCVADFSEKWSAKEKRYTAIIHEACQQAGLTSRPALFAPKRAEDLIQNCKENKAQGLVFYEKSVAENSLHRYLADAPDNIFLFIGPEGGIASREMDLFKAAKFLSVSLGSTILRTETAGLAALALVSGILREKSDWNLVGEL